MSAPELSPRQREILALAAQGQTSEQIGQELGISGATVKNHLTRAYERLGARSRTQAVLLAVQRGLIAVALLLALASPIAAQAPADWQAGHLSARGDASWWYAEVADGIAPEVWSDYGEAGVNYWSFCPAPAYQPQTCIVVAQGPWTVVRLGGPDGAILHERGRVYLPLVTR